MVSPGVQWCRVLVRNDVIEMARCMVMNAQRKAFSIAYLLSAARTVLDPSLK